MSDTVRILAIVGIVVYVVGRQLMGEPLRGKRVVLLPAILAVIGFVDLGKDGRHVEPVDVVFLVIGGAISLVIGLGQGSMLRLQSRNGYLWGQMPVKGLWWWVALVGSRVVLTLIAHGADARVAASSAPILLLLGVNRLGQAAVVMLHAMATGVPFAPERDGQSFLASTIQGAGSKYGPGSGSADQPQEPSQSRQSTSPLPSLLRNRPAPQPGVELRDLVTTAHAWLERRRGRR